MTEQLGLSWTVIRLPTSRKLSGVGLATLAEVQWGDETIEVISNCFAREVSERHSCGSLESMAR